MLRTLKLTLLTLLLIGGCGPAWKQVPVAVDPTSVVDPAKEIESVLNLQQYPPARVEATDQYVKAIYVGGGGYTKMLIFAKVADIRINTRSKVYQVHCGATGAVPRSSMPRNVEGWAGERSRRYVPMVGKQQRSISIRCDDVALQHQGKTTAAIFNCSPSSSSHNSSNSLRFSSEFLLI